MLYVAELTWSGKKDVEKEYQDAIDRVGRATLGNPQSTPLGIVAAESGLTPARVLLNHHQAGFDRRLYARPQDGGGPEEILTREHSAPTTRIRATAAPRRHEPVEPQKWGSSRRFPGQIIIEGREIAIIAASQHRKEETIWADGSRLDDRRVGAAFV